MRLRGVALLGLLVVGFAGAGLAGWPSIEGWAARSIEGRLRQETGADWRIRGGATIALRPRPELALHDVTVGADRLGDVGAQIRCVLVSDPWSLILGSGRSGRVVAEGLRLTAPLAALRPQPQASAFKALDKIATLDAVIGGVRLDLADSGRTVTAAAEALDLTFAVAEKADRTAIKARLEFPADIASVDLDLAAASGESRSGPLRLSIEPRASGRRVEATAKAVLQPSALQLDGLAGAIDRQPFSGSAKLDLSGKPRLALDLRLDALILTDATPPPGARTNDGAVMVTVRPDFIPELAWFDGYDAKAALKLGRLGLGQARFANVTVTADVRNGSLDLALAEAAYEGNARGRYVLAPEADGSGRHQFGLSLSRIRVLPMLSELVGVRGLDGTGTLRVDLQAKGTRMAELRRSASGAADLSITDGRLDGLDLAGAFGLIPGSGGAGSFTTRLDRLAGRFTIVDAHAQTDTLELKTALLEATGTGSIDFANETLDLQFKPQIVKPGVRRDEARRPPDVPVRVFGAWTHPSVSADFTGLAKDPAGTIQTLQDVGEGLLGRDGGDLGSLLGKDGGALRDMLGKDGEGLGGLLDSFIPRSQKGSPGRSRSLQPNAPERGAE